MDILPYNSNRDLDLYIAGELQSIKNSKPNIIIPDYIIEGIKQNYQTMINSDALSGFTAVDNQPFGFIVVSREEGIDQSYGLIRNLYIRPENRGARAWKALVQRVETHFKDLGLNRIGLEIYKSNESVCNLARLSGYSMERYYMEKAI